MYPRTMLILGLCFVAPFAFGQGAKPSSPFQSALPTGTPTVSLQEVMERYQRRTGTKFQIDARARKEIYAAGTDTNDLDASALHTLLRNNQLVAVRIDGTLNVIPEAVSRQYALPIVQPNEPAPPGDQLVTRIIQIENVGAPQLVPILRPLMPQYGHLAAHPDSNTLLIVDRYANVDATGDNDRGFGQPGAGRGVA